MISYIPVEIQGFVNTRVRSFASELRRVRNRRNLHQKHIAAIVGLETDTISCWEVLDLRSERHRLPKFDYVKAIIAELQLEADEADTLCRAWFIDLLMKKCNVRPGQRVMWDTDTE